MPYDPEALDREPGPAARRRSDAAWARVRDDFLAGASAPQLAERYGVSVSALRSRARSEGWRRCDAPDADLPTPEEEAAELAEAAATPTAELRATAWARAALAIRRGRLAEAQGWTRLVRQLEALAAKAAAAPAAYARAADSLASAREALTKLRSVEPAHNPPEVHEPHGMHDASGLPRSRGRWRAPQARDGGGDADVSENGGPTSTVGVTPSTACGGPPLPQAGEVGRDLHDLHGVSPEAPPPYRPAGPLLPHTPPSWVRSALGMR